MKKRDSSLPSLAVSAVWLSSLLFPCVLPAQESTTPPPDEEPVWSFDLERSSHIVRREEDRFLVRYLDGKWNFGALVASLEPQFRDDESQIALEASRSWGRHDLRFAVRNTELGGGEETLGGTRWSMKLGNAKVGVDAVFGFADLREDDFLVDGFFGGLDESVGSLTFFRDAEQGLDVEVFAHKNSTFEISRGSAQLLERLPRTRIAGIETLADVESDENRLEDAIGVRLGFGDKRFGGHVYGKTGEQLVRGIPEADDMTGFGGDIHWNSKTWGVEVEVDLRQVETNDGFDIERGRTRLDYWQHLGPFEWAVGAYVQGEAQTYSEIFDVRDTGGAALSFLWRTSEDRAYGVWGIVEQDEPDFEEVTRLALVYERDDYAYGLGVRQDEIGRIRFREKETGPMFFARGRFGRFHVDGELSVVSGSTNARLVLRLFP